MKINLFNHKIKNRRGFTLVELLIYAFLMVILLGVVFRMAIANRRQMERPAASFRIHQDFLSVGKVIRQDLEETSIGSVVIYPNDDFPKEPPGMAMLSARDKNGVFQSTPQGTPLWQKVVLLHS